MIAVFGLFLVAMGLAYVAVRMKISKREAIFSLGDHEPFKDNDPRLVDVKTPEE